ncbi:MAG: four helix bundle protein [Bacteroidetes bacterium]|nr:four helix bundle protein [Bacteroidota bacterium]
MWGNTEKSFSHFLDSTKGSLFKIETQLLIANELGCIKNKPLFKEVLGQFEEESKMLNAFTKTLKN